MRYATSVKFGRRLCEALGLEPERVNAIRFEMEAGSVARVWIKRFVTEEETDAFMALLTDYALVEQDSTLEQAVSEWDYTGMDGNTHAAVLPIRASEVR